MPKTVTSPYNVFCSENPIGGPGCGLVPLSLNEYKTQLRNTNVGWKCPRCGMDAEFDDDTYERYWLGSGELLD